MKGLYLLNSFVLKQLKVIKFGMSEVLETRWYNFTSIFCDPHYEYIYVFNDKYSKEDILYIEKLILISSEFMKQKRGFQTEYREYSNQTELDEYHNFIIEILNDYEIEFTLMNKPVFERPVSRSEFMIENDLTNEDLTDIGENPFERTRNSIQREYINEVIEELESNKKVLMKAPTGFGKSKMIFNILGKKLGLMNIIFTPRKNLNEQMISEKYRKELLRSHTNIIYYDFSSSTQIEDRKLLDDIIERSKPILIVLCYQSARMFYEFLKINDLLIFEGLIENVIYDEAHFIASWYRDNIIDFTNSEDSEDSSESEDDLTEEELKNIRKLKYKQFWLLNNFNIENRIFTTATPLESMILNEQVYGKCIEKVKVHELMNMKILCDIVTVVQTIDEGYPDLIPMIQQCMNKFNKKKGIIYVNNQINAKLLYNLCKQYLTNIHTFISISEKEFDELKEFDEYSPEDKSIIVTCQKISMGYDNDYIDFICFADPKYSEIDIRQSLGRGLRWPKDKYEYKMLHVLLPVYKKDFIEDKTKFNLIKKYLDFIIGECDKDIIYDSDGNIFISNNSTSSNENNYLGNIIPIEILNEYCTNGYHKYSKFMVFLKENGIYEENIYLEKRRIIQWLPELENIKLKYPKFNFQLIHPLKNHYYQTIDEALLKYHEANEQVKIMIGMNEYRRITAVRKTNLIKSIDDKIPKDLCSGYYQIVKDT